MHPYYDAFDATERDPFEHERRQGPAVPAERRSRPLSRRRVGAMVALAGAMWLGVGTVLAQDAGPSLVKFPSSAAQAVDIPIADPTLIAATASATPVPTATPSPSPSPIAPTAMPTGPPARVGMAQTPTAAPTSTPSSTPSAAPTPRPTLSPTPSPSSSPVPPTR